MNFKWSALKNLNDLLGYEVISHWLFANCDSWEHQTSSRDMARFREHLPVLIVYAGNLITYQVKEVVTLFLLQVWWSWKCCKIKTWQNKSKKKSRFLLTDWSFAFELTLSAEWKINMCYSELLWNIITNFSSDSLQCLKVNKRFELS